MTRPHLLLLEDTPDATLIVRRYAARAGQDIVACQTVAEAWERLQGGPRPDLVLVDVNLPGESGLDLCRLVRANATLAELPLALFGGRDRSGDLVAGLDAGIDFFLSKDLLARPDAWQDRVREILEAIDGRHAPPSLSWTGPATPGSPPAPAAGLDALNFALRHVLARQYGTDVVQALLRRAVGQPAQSPSTSHQHENALAPDGVGLDVERTDAPRVAAALAEQLWRLFGSTASAAGRAALAAVSPPWEASP